MHLCVDMVKTICKRGYNMKKITQCDRVLQHLQMGKGITPAQAIKEYGVYRLSAVIYTLKKDGYNIETKMVAHKNRYGDKIYFAKYFLVI